jgi:hypothetical protein
VLLAYPYADALAGRGYPVQVLPSLGTRELVDPALMVGLVQLVPEYTGSALEFASLGQVPATASVAATVGHWQPRWPGGVDHRSAGGRAGRQRHKVTRVRAVSRLIPGMGHLARIG